jgi:hypothetical protein
MIIIVVIDILIAVYCMSGIDHCISLFAEKAAAQ